MENSLYIGLSKQVVLRENMDIIAQNVANVNTPGYRAQNMVFSEYISDPRHMEEDRGFLGIQTPGGEIQYTRAGNLTLDQDGKLVNARGMAVMDDGGAEINIPQNAREVYIDKRGAISTEQGQIANLMIMEFGNTQELNPAGNGLYETDAQPIPSETTAVNQGYLEGSNVQAVVEMTRMIDVLREYQAVQNIMKSEHERMKGANQRLARTQA